MPRKGNVKRSIVTPKPIGIAAATLWPPSFAHQDRPRKSSTTPTHVATAAPSRMPRYGPSSSMNASAGTKIPSRSAMPAEAGDRPDVHAPPLTRLVDDAEDAREAPDRGRQDEDDARARAGSPRGLPGCLAASAT